MALKTAGLGTYTLAGSISSTATSITLSSFKVPITNTDVTMTTMGTSIAYGTISPGTANSEFISFTGITQNANGTATLTGVTRGLDKQSPYTTSSSFKRPHSGQAQFILSDSPNLWDSLAIKQNDETISGKYTFPQDNINNAGVATDIDTTVATAFVTLGQLSRQAIAGASNASTTVKGIVELATQAEYDSRTTTGATGAKLVPTPDIVRNVLTHDYAVDAGSTDAYAITLTPAVTAYTTGDIYYFKANTVNTGACTLNVNAVGPKSIKIGGSDPYDGYIAAGAYVACQYDGTNMNMIWCSSAIPVSQKGTEVYGTDSVGTDAYAITLIPAPIAYVTGATYRFKAGTANTGAATLNVNGLGAKAIVKNYNADLETGDILANQIVQVTYDGTNMQMTSPTAQTGIYAVSTDINASYYTITAGLVSSSSTVIQGWTVSATTPSVSFPIGGAAPQMTIGDTSGGGITISTNIFGATSDSYSYPDSKSIRLKMRVKLGDTTDRKGWGLAVTASNIHTAQTDTTNGEIRFIANGATLYAQNANGTATSTDISSGITLTQWNTYEIVFVPGTSISYYVNGTLKATHTTNLPTTGTPLLCYGANTNNRTVILMSPIISVQQ